MTSSDARLLHVQQLLPERGISELGRLLEQLQTAEVTVPFHSSRRDFIADVARELGRRGRGLPETQALAYWMRKAEIHRLGESFAALGSESCVLMPRGTVFHIPPANVDTLFVYSWVLSTLVGNRNIVRLSSRATDQSNLIVDTIRDVLRRHPDVEGSTSMITYGHDDAITRAISAESDVRVVWGGDATVRRVRSVPLPPHATELVFADRFSMAAIDIASYRALTEAERDRLAQLFFNDAYWFDQLGCSSARLLLWVGSGELATASSDFYDRVRSIARHKAYQVDASAAIAKLSQSHRTMIDAEVGAYSAPDNVITVLTMSSFPDVRGEFCGAGLFYELQVASITDIAPHIKRADQTLATFGVPEVQLQRLVQMLCGRGIDRIVPFGQALQFNRFWDGYDLLSELTRKVTITTQESVG